MLRRNAQPARSRAPAAAAAMVVAGSEAEATAAVVTEAAAGSGWAAAAAEARTHVTLTASKKLPLLQGPVLTQQLDCTGWKATRVEVEEAVYWAAPSEGGTSSVS
jgi:hypothetical protein